MEADRLGAARNGRNDPRPELAGGLLSEGAMKPTENPIATLISQAGGTRAVAEALGVHRETVARWRWSGKCGTMQRLAIQRLIDMQSIKFATMEDLLSI